ncbi:uncharacterized protein ACR2FA_006983 [Aphomia sociella]
MLSKFAVLLACFALSNAVPIQIFSNGVAVSSGGLPLRQTIGQPIAPANRRPTVASINRPTTQAINRPINQAINSPLYDTPSIAFGFGSGFSSDIAGIKHSTSIGSSFSTGNGRAYGSGIGSTGNNYASGTGVANVEPPSTFLTPEPRYDSYGNPVLNYDSGYIAVPAAQEENSLSYYPIQTNEWSPNYDNNGQFQSAVSSTQNAGELQSAISLAQNQQGNGYQTALSATHNDNYYRSSISNAQSADGSNFGSATAATQNIDGVNASTAQVVQRYGGSLQQSGATVINGPGIQAAQSHAINTGYY